VEYINFFATLIMVGWWLVSGKGGVGYISSEYLKPYKDHNIWKSMSSDDLQKYLGFACEESPPGTGDGDTAQLKYVAVEEYQTNDPRQLCLEKDEMVLVVEMSEDGMFASLQLDGVKTLCSRPSLILSLMPGSFLSPPNPLSLHRCVPLLS
jgi:hypothetical protein